MAKGSTVGRPIIIKRKRVVAAAAHHGGAWKVAYADFVTAMMAFFLLMWLLNATTEDQRIALATYFTPTISISNTSGGGDGALGGDTIFAEDTLAQMGTGATDIRPTEARAARGDSGAAPLEQTGSGEEAALADRIENALRASGGESNLADDLMRHIHTEVTDEGVVIEITGLPGAELFASGEDEPTVRLGVLVDLVAGILPLVENDIAVAAYREDGTRPASGTARADAVAALMTRQELPSARLARVSGLAGSGPGDVVTGVRPDDRVVVTILREQPGD